MIVVVLVLFFSVFVPTCYSQDTAISITQNDDSRENLVIRNKSQIIRASPVRNVRVNAFYFHDDDSIKFNVSWERPTDESVPKYFSVKVVPLNESNPYCESDYYESHMAKSNDTYYTLPPSFSKALKIMPECTYRIEVIAEPNDARVHPYIYYTVPFCVEQLCSCNHANLLPTPKFEIDQISEHEIRVRWTGKTYDKTWMEHNNVTRLHVGIGQNGEPSLLHETVISVNVTNSNLYEHNTLNIPKKYKLVQGMRYTVSLYFETQYNCKSLTQQKTFAAKIITPSVHWVLNVLIPIMCFIMFIGLTITVFWQKKGCWCLRKLFCYHQPSPISIYRGRNRPFISIPMEYNNMYIEKEVQDEMDRGNADKYEICYSRLKFGEEIGKGAFGQVFIATATALPGKSGICTVAVKKLKKEASSEEKDEFLIEIDMLKRIGRHPNIVTLLGCCTIKQPYCMLMEYVPCGDLWRYLHALRRQYETKYFLSNLHPFHRNSSANHHQKSSDCSYIVPDTPTSERPSITETECTTLSSERFPSTPLVPKTPTLECVLDAEELQSFAIQIAKGMEHLESKQIIHRDLAARNILIDENRTLKISDFGFSRKGIYVNTKNRKVPLRWLSVEAIRDNLYTNKSDVWAYGIVLWEIGTLGGFPYPSVDNSNILNFLLQGKRLTRPEICTTELYSLMLKCWSYHDEARPSFKSIVEYLKSISNKQRAYVDFSQLNPSYLFPPTEEQTFPKTVVLDSLENITVEIIYPGKSPFSDRV